MCRKRRYLVSTVRPVNRNIALINRNLSNLVASTGFCVLRPKANYREYLLSIVTSDKFTDKMCDIASGGLYPAVNNGDVLSYEIFIPDEETLNRVTSIYQQADKSEFDGLKSQFIEMFTNNNFEMVPLGDLCDKISDGSHNPPKGIENSKYLMISSKNVFKDHLDLTDVRYLTEEDFEVENKRTNVKANDVLLTIVGTIGRTYLVKGDEGNLVMQRSVAVLTPNSRVTPLFLMFYLHSDKNLEKEGRGNAQKGIYLKQLSQYEIKVPSIDLQKQFKAIYRQADKVRISNFANR